MLAGLARLLPRPAWQGLFLQPAAVLRWHRDLVRRRWSYSPAWPAIRGGGGPRVGAAAGSGKPDLGYRRIHGELCRLGYQDKIGASTVWTILQRAGVAPAPVRAPRANAYARRWVGTVRRELLGRMLIFGRRQLVSVLAEYANHYNVHRPHRALGQVPPLGSVESAAVLSARRVVWRDRFGGLIHECAQVA